MYYKTLTTGEVVAIKEINGTSFVVGLGKTLSDCIVNSLKVAGRISSTGKVIY